MRDFIVNTNFGHTYKWTAEMIAEDYADTAIQWQHEETEPKSKEYLYQQILNDEEFLAGWFNDYIQGDVNYSRQRAELVSVNTDTFNLFLDWALTNHGEEV